MNVRTVAAVGLFLASAATPSFPIIGSASIAMAQMTPPPQASMGAPLKGVPVRLTDRQGRPISAPSLPPEAQAQLARVQQAAASLAAGAGPGERIRVSINCTYPPLSCTITVTF